MFSSLGLFQTVRCPSVDSCTRVQCLFTHRADLPTKDTPVVEQSQTVSTASTSTVPTGQPHVIPAKRTSSSISSPTPGKNEGAQGEPSRKRQILSFAQKPLAVPSASQASTGAPILRVNAARSRVPVPVRQAMLKSLYEQFVVMYAAILPSNPAIAAEHALKQEEEVYEKSNKLTYRNAVIMSIAALKRRPFPDSISHPSVGTEEDLQTRAELLKTVKSTITLTRTHLQSLLLTNKDMQNYGYILDIPDGPGGDRPNEEGNVRTCERCSQPFMVKGVAATEECAYHWGRPYSKTINGEKLRIYNCCSKPTSQAEGCVRGPHVFYEHSPSDLHSRHPFSRSRPATMSEDTALDVVALDCEMIFTTAGFTLARVSVIDGTGREIFDEFVRMSDEVEVVDYNTRFSGVTEENCRLAILSLSAVRTSLDAFISSDTIIIGHALENDLKALRMIHTQCVDTAVLFPHRSGPPYRRALRDLVKEHLGSVIQAGGGTVGHSSVEDSIATLDLVKLYVQTKSKANRGDGDSR